MRFDLDEITLYVRIGAWLDYAFAALVLLLVPAWFVWYSQRSPRSWRILRTLLFAALVWVAAVLVYGLVSLVMIDRGGYALLGLLAPLAGVYGLRKARRSKAVMDARGQSLPGAVLRILPVPLLVFAALNVAVVDQAMEVRFSDNPLYEIYGFGSPDAAMTTLFTGNGVADAAISALRLLGYGAMTLFFLSLPYVVGSLLACALLVLHRMGWEAPLRAQERDSPASITKGHDPMSHAQPSTPLVIAIDGPAAAGKGTLAKRLAARYGLPYLDTGLLYRAVGRRAEELQVDLDDPVQAGIVARSLAPSALDDGSLRGREAGELASRVAVHQPVREALTAFQRDFAGRPEGAVLDGRDIGTVICPNAPVKIFVTASAEVRARRRTDELASKGRSVEYERILAEVHERDRRDSERADAPLKAAPDAHLLDTSDLDIEAAFRAACDLVDRSVRRNEG